MSEDRVDVSVAARLLRVSEEHVRRLIRHGELAAFNAARGQVPRWQIERAEIERFIRERSTSHNHNQSG